MDGKRNRSSVASGKGRRCGSGVRGRDGRDIPRVSASMTSSRAVITQSVSLTGPPCIELGMSEPSGSGGRQ